MNLVLASLSSPDFTASCCIWEFPSTHYYLTLKTMEMFSWHLFLTDIFSGVSQPEEAMNNFVSLLDHFVQLVLHPLTDLSEDLRGKLWQWQKLHMRMWGRGCPSQCLQEVTTTSHRLAKGSQGINLGLNRVNVLHYKICVNTVNGTECVSSIYISYCTVCCSISIWIKKASNSTYLRQKARCRESVFKQDKRVLMKTKSPEWVCYKEKLCLWKGFYVSLKPGVAAFIPAPQPVWYWYVWVVFESLALSSDR